MSLPREDLDHVLNRTRDFWEELRSERLFITGGTGFFGVWLLRTFLYINEALALSASVTVLTRDPDRFLENHPDLSKRKDLHFLKGDVASFTFPNGNFSHVIHAATDVTRTGISASNQIETAVNGTIRLIEFARLANARKLLLTSSGAIYGRQPIDIERVPEEYPGAPDPLGSSAVYGEGKRMAEVLVAAFARESTCEAKIARCFAFVGPYLPLDAHYAIGNFIAAVLARRPLRMTGDGSALRSYLYASDLAVWLWTILYRGVPARAYNVGSPHALSISELAGRVLQCAGQPVPELSVSSEIKKVQRYVPSTQRATRELGLEVYIGLDEAIRKTILWHRDQNTL